MIFIVTYVAYPKRLGLRFVIGEYSVRLPGIRARRTIRIISSDDFLIYIFFPTQFKRPNVKITHPVRTVVYCSAAVTRNDDVLCYVSYAFRRAVFTLSNNYRYLACRWRLVLSYDFLYAAVAVSRKRVRTCLYPSTVRRGPENVFSIVRFDKRFTASVVRRFRMAPHDRLNAGPSLITVSGSPFRATR